MPGMEILAMVMAGGKGERLWPLTAERSKPSVPFGGKYRLIDFVLSNLVNSHITSIYVLTQYLAQSLLEHLSAGWNLRDIRGRDFITAVPAQMRTGDMWYRGTADAIFQNMNLVRDHRPTTVAVFGADHVYRMDVRLMMADHLRNRADATVAAIPMPASQCHQFGVIEVDPEWRIVGFEEKPSRNPKTIPGRPDSVLASMGNYLFQREFLDKVITEDAARQGAHDFGKSILPEIYKSFRVFAYDFSRNDFPGRVKGEERSYWRDVGTILSYYDANMDLRTPDPVFNLYNAQWPLQTAPTIGAPAKFVFNDEGRRGMAVDSIISEGTIVSGGSLDGCVVGRNVFVHSYSHVAESIVMDGVDIGRNCRIRRAIIDKNVRIPPGSTIGAGGDPFPNSFVDPESGVTVIPKLGVKLEE
jgi:glucose-1-phosphate adenylyltransferase